MDPHARPRAPSAPCPASWWALWAFAAACAVTPGCTCTELPPSPTAISAAYEERFERASLGPDWRPTDEAAYQIVGGELVARRAHNHPLWLTRPLPRNARIEFDCWSNDDDGDLKVEAWGDGRSYATDLVGQYTSTAYNFIFGGWHNQTSTVARLNEHGGDRHARSDVRVERGRRYHFTISRRGSLVDWQIDGRPFLSFDDPQPLEGPGHSHFAFTDWEAELHFDNLVIAPL